MMKRVMLVLALLLLLPSLSAAKTRLVEASTLQSDTLEVIADVSGNPFGPTLFIDGAAASGSNATFEVWVDVDGSGTWTEYLASQALEFHEATADEVPYWFRPVFDREAALGGSAGGASNTPGMVGKKVRLWLIAGSVQLTDVRIAIIY